ncbi:M14-type cytosolic carboxypeptidase [Rubellicoccus peritrichatus]|uniref:M14-type cytosolic carboxypeptidase n=1 Tax=Rubellicoccus peritrichatus TaxID=3080537 RepID=A0AAQ3LEL0_9BACT|nr:M14-type cytosolic carboxypeptidase [Puniceicoccus sp. CR14]WOO43282.1 M14-type cytosolic carboxypeptidase [Puniceicoccus sp. CR14]
MSAETLWIEPENFPMLRHWKMSRQASVDCLSGAQDGRKRDLADATDSTIISIEKPGNYRLWVRGFDAAGNSPGKRHFRVGINGQTSNIAFGTHGKYGLEWQSGGEFELSAGECQIDVIDTSSFWARIDKIMLTTELIYTPEGKGGEENIRHLNKGNTANETPLFNDGITIDANFPGGNIIVSGREQNTFFIRQDLRDNMMDWFYWCFRVRGASGKKLTFKFTGTRAIGVHGPAISTDFSKWKWLGLSQPDEYGEFSYSFEQGEDLVFFSNAIPYVKKNLDEFLEDHRPDKNLDISTLAHTKKGTPVPMITLGRKMEEHTKKIVIVARQHASESMGSYVLEGFMEAFLSQTQVGHWFQSNTTCICIPLVDIDGVEAGDQGKGRSPRDHNQDYTTNKANTYLEIAAIQELLLSLPKKEVCALIDIHCPGLYGRGHELIFQVGQESPLHWQEQVKFAKALEKAENDNKLPYKANNDMAKGEGWNHKSELSTKFSTWSASHFDCLVTTFEFPYANAEGTVVDQDSARAFGKRLCVALKSYLSDSEK